MSQEVTQGVASYLVAILSKNQSGVLGLTSSDITVQYAKSGDTSFTLKALTDTSGSVTSGSAETYNLTDGQTLTVAVDGGAAGTATFNTGDFGDISLATAAEIAAVITADIAGATATAVGGYVVITSDTAGSTSSVEVTGGTANTALAFPTNVNYGISALLELGNGVYQVYFTGAELSNVGTLTFIVNGATIDQSFNLVNVLAVTNTPTTVSLQTCIITGHVYGLDGNPLVNVGVSARILGSPSIEQNSVVVADTLISTKTDVTGQFFLTMVRLADVEIYIPEVNYRRRLVVPNTASANLFTDIV